MSNTFCQVKPKRKKLREEDFLKPYAIIVSRPGEFGLSEPDLKDYFIYTINSEVSTFQTWSNPFVKVFFEDFDKFKKSLLLDGYKYKIEIDYSRLSRKQSKN